MTTKTVILIDMVPPTTNNEATVKIRCGGCGLVVEYWVAYNANWKGIADKSFQYRCCRCYSEVVT